MKYLYIVDHFCPFPTSEYGGVWNVVAKDDEECFDLITEYDQEQYPQFYGNLRKNIQDARAYTLLDEVNSEVIEAFTT
jgi:hypothetical protein|tara:strand:+ start:283 stop:516 length:234 start_codon:yes stop_codon:yes gene_type:complete